jgi:hypothetical protein
MQLPRMIGREAGDEEEGVWRATRKVEGVLAHHVRPE